MHSLAVKKHTVIGKSARTGLIKHKLYAPTASSTLLSSLSTLFVPLSPASGTRMHELRPRCYVGRSEKRIEMEYAEEMMGCMKKMEKATLANAEMMDMQPELEWYMRPYLIDFLMEVHSGFRLQPATLYLTVNLMDRYASKRIVFKKHYQLLGCSALWIAAKYEEPKERVPTLKDLCTMCCDSYRCDMFVQMESHIIKTLDWKIGHPTTYAFLMMEIERRGLGKKMGEVAQFLSEVALYHRDMIDAPSVIAEASVILAEKMMDSMRGRKERSIEVILCMGKLEGHLKELSSVVVKKYAHIGIKKIVGEYLERLEKYGKEGDRIDAEMPQTPLSIKQKGGEWIKKRGGEFLGDIMEEIKEEDEEVIGLPTPPAEEGLCCRYGETSSMI